MYGRTYWSGINSYQLRHALGRVFFMRIDRHRYRSMYKLTQDYYCVEIWYVVKHIEINNPRNDTFGRDDPIAVTMSCKYVRKGSLDRY